MNWKEILNMNYPHNILYVLGIEHPNQDQIDGFYYVINNIELKDNYKGYLSDRFWWGMTLEQIGQKYGRPRQSIDFCIKTCLEKIKNSKNWPYIYYGYVKYTEMLKIEQERKEQERLEKEKREKREKEIELHKIQKRDKDIHRKRIQRQLDKNDFSMSKDLKENGYFFAYKIIPQKAYQDLFYNYKDKISVRLFNCIRRKWFSEKYEYGATLTIADILETIKKNPYWYKDVRNLGKEGIIELYNLLYNLGYLTKFELDYLSSFRSISKTYKPKEQNIHIDMGTNYWYNNYIGKWGE